MSIDGKTVYEIEEQNMILARWMCISSFSMCSNPCVKYHITGYKPYKVRLDVIQNTSKYVFCASDVPYKKTSHP